MVQIGISDNFSFLPVQALCIPPAIGMVFFLRYYMTYITRATNMTLCSRKINAEGTNRDCEANLSTTLSLGYHITYDCDKEESEKFPQFPREAVQVRFGTLHMCTWLATGSSIRREQVAGLEAQKSPSTFGTILHTLLTYLGKNR